MDLNKGSLFGKTIAYVLPGLLALWALSRFDEGARQWLATVAEQKETTIGAFLFAVLASLGLGIIFNGIRWQLLEDWIFKRPDSGVPPMPELDYRKRKDNDATIAQLHESQYRFFQFYGNSGVALLAAAILRLAHSPFPPLRETVLAGLLVIGLEIMFYRVAKSCLIKYRKRLISLLGPTPVEDAA